MGEPTRMVKRPRPEGRGADLGLDQPPRAKRGDCPYRLGPRRCACGAAAAGKPRAGPWRQ